MLYQKAYQCPSLITSEKAETKCEDIAQSPEKYPERS